MRSKKLKTPLIKPRTQGGTFYTFASALEDVGLNINELRNKISLSHYVLLNIPSFKSVFSSESSISNDSVKNEFNVGDYTFAQYFQSYVLNMETVLRNQASYNFADSLTVSERVFWKYLESIGAISLEKDLDKNGNPTGYFVDKFNCVQAFGAINSGAQRTDSYGLYNETFVQIPSSYGKMKVLFKNVNDRNFYQKKFYADSSDGLIEYLDDTERNNGQTTLHTGLSGEAIYDNVENGIGYYEVGGDSNSHSSCVEFALSELRKYYNDDSLTYDDIGISHAINNLTAYDSSIDSSTDSSTDSSLYNFPTDSSVFDEDFDSTYEFNAILVYYSIYDSTGKNTLATNAYGVLILDNAVQDGNLYKFPTLVKKKSTLENIGNSYSFRLNIKTTSVYNGDITVNDNSTAGYGMSTDFNDMISNLGKAVEILKTNSNIISRLSQDDTRIKSLATQALDKLDSMEKTINSLKTGIYKTLKTNILRSDFAALNSIDASTTFGDSSTGETVGTIANGELTFAKINTPNLNAQDSTIENLTVNNFSIKEQDLAIKNPDGKNEVYVKFNNNGVYSGNTFYFEDKNSNPESVEFEGTEGKELIDNVISKTVIQNIKIYEDGEIILPPENEVSTSSEIIYKEENHITPSEADIEVLHENVKNVYENLYQKGEEGAPSYINLLSLIGCLIDNFKYEISSIHDELDELTKKNTNS